MKICIIKLGALGDVIRTLPIIEGINEKYSDADITWITKENAVDLLANDKSIKRVLSVNNCREILDERFDILYNFDTEEEATSLAMKIIAEKKYGFCWEGGYPSGFNAPSEYYLNTVFDDELKKNNLKTYQEMMFMAAELPYKKQHRALFPNEEDRKYAEDFIEKNKINRQNLIGIHIGADSRWPSKIWYEENLKEFIKKSSENEYEIIILGGPNESNKINELEKEMLKHKIKIYKNNPENLHMQFASIVDLCMAIVCYDSFALHVSLAMKKPTIGLFFCTPPNEVEGYGLLKKIVSPKIYDFFPEKMDMYDEDLVKSISADEVLKEIVETCKIKRAVNAIIKNNDGKFLLIKRIGGIHDGKWAFPGGVVNEKETLGEALKREIKEETGLEINRIISKISQYRYLGEEGKEVFGECFYAEAKKFDVKISRDIADFRWVSVEDMENLEIIPGIDGEMLLTFK